MLPTAILAWNVCELNSTNCLALEQVIVSLKTRGKKVGRVTLRLIRKEMDTKFWLSRGSFEKLMKAEDLDKSAHSCKLSPVSTEFWGFAEARGQELLFWRICLSKSPFLVGTDPRPLAEVLFPLAGWSGGGACASKPSTTSLGCNEIKVVRSY